MSNFKQFWARLNRTQWKVVAVALAIVIIGVGFGVGFSIASSNARTRKDQQNTANLNAFTKWQMKLTAGFSMAQMASMAVGGFCTAFADVAANMSASSTDPSRVRTLDDLAWSKIATDIWESVPGMQALEIQSGGVISQNWPRGREGEIGLDVYNLPSDHLGYLEVIAEGEVKILGPGPLWSGGTGIFFRYPIYSAHPKSAATFWGTGNVILQVEQFMASQEIDRMIVEDGMEYLFWYYDGSVDVDVLVSDPSLRDQIRTKGMRMELPVAENGKAAYFAIYPSAGFEKDAMRPADLAVIVVITLIGSVLVSIFASVILFGFLAGRSHANAPKDPSQPFTLLFTDIQSSTSLWAEIPDDMGQAMVEHHRIIRELIKKHRGYEVKTIGDSFMVAFKHAEDAVKLSSELQHCFYNCLSFPKSIDACYVAFDKEKMMMEGIYNDDGLPKDHHFYNLSCRLSSERYAKRWRGLRVRCGINTAFGDIKRDEVADSFDYYGTVANTAARVESVAHGGQVVMTESTLLALHDFSLEVVDGCDTQQNHHHKRGSGAADMHTEVLGSEGYALNEDDADTGTVLTSIAGGGGNNRSVNTITTVAYNDPEKYYPSSGAKATDQNNNNTQQTVGGGMMLSSGSANSGDGVGGGAANPAALSLHDHHDANAAGDLLLSPVAPPPRMSENKPPRFVMSLGKVELRGLADPIKLFELQCVVGRVYPPLRLERQIDDELAEGVTDSTNGGGGGGGGSGATPSSQNATGTDSIFGGASTNVTVSGIFSNGGGGGGGGIMGGAGETQSIRSSNHSQNNGGIGGGSSNVPSYPKVQFAAVLLTSVSTLPVDQRLKTLKKMAESWRITGANNPSFATPDAIRATKNATLLAILALANGNAQLTGLSFSIANRLHKVASAKLSRVADIRTVVGADGTINIETRSHHSTGGGGGPARGGGEGAGQGGGVLGMSSYSRSITGSHHTAATATINNAVTNMASTTSASNLGGSTIHNALRSASNALNARSLNESGFFGASSRGGGGGGTALTGGDSPTFGPAARYPSQGNVHHVVPALGLASSFATSTATSPHSAANVNAAASHSHNNLPGGVPSSHSFNHTVGNANNTNPSAVASNSYQCTASTSHSNSGGAGAAAGGGVVILGARGAHQQNGNSNSVADTRSNSVNRLLSPSPSHSFGGGEGPSASTGGGGGGGACEGAGAAANARFANHLALRASLGAAEVGSRGADGSPLSRNHLGGAVTFLGSE